MESFGTSKRLRLRRADRCVRCGREFTPGDEALWYGEARVVTCVDCSADAESAAPVALDLEVTAEPDLQVGVAGASARREYDRRRQRREDYARERLGRLGIVLARLTDDPQSTRAWERGAKGEAFVGKRLEKHLAGSEVKILHDRRVPGHGNANLDHIAIGPGGITLIDTKNYRGKLRVQRVGGLFSERRTILTIDGRDRTRLVKAVEVQIELVRTALLGTEHADLDITGAFCFADVDGLPLLAQQQLRGITIDGPRRVAKLASIPGGLNPNTIERVRRLIGQTFPPA
jgi:Nuclease-related domain